MPNKLRNERNLFATSDCQAKIKLSFKSKKNIA